MKEWLEPRKNRFATIAERITKHVNSPQVLDITRNIARFSAFLDSMEERIEDLDTPSFRYTICRMLKDAVESGNPEDVEKAYEYALKAKHEDEAWRQLLGVAERQATLQARASELFLRGDSALSAKQVLMLFGQILKIVSEEVDKDKARKIAARASKEIFCIEPKVGILGPISEEGNDPSS